MNKKELIPKENNLSKKWTNIVTTDFKMAITISGLVIAIIRRNYW